MVPCALVFNFQSGHSADDAHLRARRAVGRGGLPQLALRGAGLPVEHAAQRVDELRVELLHLVQLRRRHLLPRELGGQLAVAVLVPD